MSASIALPLPQSIASHKGVWLAMLSAVGFSAKAIFVKLAYQYHVDPTRKNVFSHHIDSLLILYQQI